jgi:hypothetical protein
LLKKAIKPLLYELVDNYQAQSVAEQNYLIAKRDFRRKI